MHRCALLLHSFIQIFSFNLSPSYIVIPAILFYAVFTASAHYRIRSPVNPDDWVMICGQVQHFIHCHQIKISLSKRKTIHQSGNLRSHVSKTILSLFQHLNRHRSMENMSESVRLKLEVCSSPLPKHPILLMHLL